MNRTIILKIREIMKREGIDGYILKNSDYHNSEYISERYRVIEKIIGFTGSFGELLITKSNIVFWTDSRYDLQIKEKLKNEDVEIITTGKEGSLRKEEWIEKILEKGAVIAFDGRTYTSLEGEKTQKELSENGYITKYNLDIVDEFWEKRPNDTKEQAFELDIKYAGKSREEKLKDILAKIKEIKGDYLVVQSLGEIAWILNIRGRDIKNNPFVTGNLIISQKGTTFYTDKDKISNELQNVLLKANVRLEKYENFYSVIGNIESESVVVVDNGKINYKLKMSIAKNKNITLKNSENMISLMMSCKNKVEISNMKKAYLKDGIAVTKFIYWIKNEVKTRKVSEEEVATKMDSIRKNDLNFIEPSFDTISAYEENAAMPHYSYKSSEKKYLDKKGIYLFDTGGQYLDGTTDITRTISLGETKESVKKDYTLVLKGMIGVSQCKILDGTTGTHIDFMAREHMWKYGINFNHGTGHGIGYLGGVHEGPYGISPRFNSYKLIPGVIITNEPGIYRDGLYGIRIENTLLVKEYMNTEFGKFYEFETLTVAPIDVELLEKEMLTKDELEWLKKYNETVFVKLKDYLEKDEVKWLKAWIEIE